MRQVAGQVGHHCFSSSFDLEVHAVIGEGLVVGLGESVELFKEVLADEDVALGHVDEVLNLLEVYAGGGVVLAQLHFL